MCISEAFLSSSKQHAHLHLTGICHCLQATTSETMSGLSRYQILTCGEGTKSRQLSIVLRLCIKTRERPEHEEEPIILVEAVELV